MAQLAGGDPEDRRAVAAAACGELGFALREIPARNLPCRPSELEALARFWEREAALFSSALLVECGEHGAGKEAREDGQHYASPRALAGPSIAAERGRLKTPRRRFFSLRMPKPPAEEKKALWLGALGRRRRALTAT